MDKITGRLTRLFLFFFTGIAAYISWFTFTQWDRAGFLYPLLSAPERVCLIGAGALLVLAVCGLFVRFTRSMGARQERLFAAVCLLLLFAGQLLLIFGIRQSTFTYDPYRVFDEALRMLSSRTVSGTALEGYFGIYPNNIPFTLLVYWVLRLGSLAGLADAGLMALLQVLNALCMDAAVFFTYRLLTAYVRPSAGRLFLFFCLINPLTFLWPGFVYTSTVSMPFLTGGLLLFLKLWHTQDRRKKILCGLALGGVLFLGYKIRATVLITLIAGLIYLFLYRENAKERLRERLLRQFPGLLALALSLAVCFPAWGAIQKAYVSFDSTDTAFPVVSWLAMGLQGDGMFSTEDYYDTKNAPTAEEKRAVNEEKLKTRLAQLGPRGWLDLAGRKLVRTWADGTDDYVSYLNQYDRTGKLHSYLLEDKRDLIVCYMQMLRCLLFLLMTAGGVLLWLRRDESRSPLLLLQLNLLGGTLFHVLWETGELYSLCFSFLLFALAADGYERIAGISAAALAPGAGQPGVRRPWRSFLPSAGLLALLVLTAGWLFVRTPDFTSVPVKKHGSFISQKTYTDAAPSGLTAGETLSQTFSCAQPFNRVAVRVKNVLPEGKNSQYHVAVTSEHGDVLLNTTVTGYDVFDYDYFYFGLDTEAAPDVLTEYTITIACITGDADNSIAFLSYDTGGHDAYRPGSLSKNGEEIDKADLNFMVYRSYEDTYFQPKTWYALCGALLLLEGAAAVLYVPGRRTN